ncbi:precorrin-3B C17-methyltransferase [Vibrio coralliilyticus]|uniref:Probable queuosine precursor transporter n=2 Tax=Vibrio coralliilyticus TaxID=190893 RepID=A0A097AYM1_9VIBR|nr:MULTISPECIES: queuosine precursor transporter [Vibrionaceae]MCG9596116.1 queuosine precursor transporter [Vibrio sp. Isolate25]MCG9677611.1 queuosine precursor transporter [Vibrio sp. Isolate24]MCG9681974.1 queuosine precursor transporter [Vibrio sp. Isolate23]MCM5508195.1 queuosine precursor transporter [Vibrio sp. SCSIO 43169]AIS57482.1 precorrin-3B C17-methyltransferase [Vibrio coralliilyticus]
MFNKKYKLIGFNGAPEMMASVMIRGTGKVVNMPAKDLISSEVADDLNRNELVEVCKKVYSKSSFEGAYELEDRHESYWMSYSFLVLCLCSLFTLSNITGIKPVEIFNTGLIVPAAIFLYPISFIFVDILNEYFGLKLARKAIIQSTVVNAGILVLLYLSTTIPSIGPWQAMDEQYTSLVTSMTSVFLASLSSYFISENINAYVLNKIKIATQSRWLAIRVIASTSIASVVDSALFISIAFFNVLPNDVLFVMFLSQVTIKILYALFSVAPIYFARKLFSRLINVKELNNNDNL